MASRRPLLYGRTPAVSRQLALLAVGLFVLVSATFYTDVNTLWPAPLGASGVVLLVGLAGVVAYYNEGLLVTWLLAFAAALPAFVFHPPRGPVLAVTAATAPRAIAEAAGVAIGLGTIGFAVGSALRRRRDRRRGELHAPSAAVLPALVVGSDRQMAARWLIVGVAEFAVLFASGWFGLLPFGFGAGGTAGIAAVLILMTVPAAWYAAANEGLVVCWALAFAPVFGIFLAIQLRFVGTPAPDRPVLYAIGTAALFAIPTGTVAFVVGLAGRRLRQRLGPWPGQPARSDESPGHR